MTPDRPEPLTVGVLPDLSAASIRCLVARLRSIDTSALRSHLTRLRDVQFSRLVNDEPDDAPLDVTCDLLEREVQNRDLEAWLREAPLHAVERFALIDKTPRRNRARRVLQERREAGENFGVRPPDGPTRPNAVPYDPEGTVGDYWRTKML